MLNGTASVAADLEAGEEPIRLADLRDASFVPRRGGRKVDKSAPFRWASRGVQGHRLESMKTPAGLVTTRSAWLRFCAALAGERSPAAATPRNQRQREAAVRHAERELEAAGI